MAQNEPLQNIEYPVLGDPNNPPKYIESAVKDLVQRSNMRFTTTTARNDAITSPVDGMECYTGSGASAVKWIRHNGEWIARGTDTGWISSGVTITGNTNFAVSGYLLRKRDSHVKGRIAVTFSASATALSSDASGDFANVALPIIPAEWSPNGFAAPLNMERTGAAMHYGWAETTGQLRLTSSSLQSAQVLIPGATYLIYLDHFTA